VELLDSGNLSSADRTDLFRDVHTAVEQGRRLVRDVLELSRHHIVQHKDVDLAACVRRACRMVARTMPGIELELHTTEPLPMLPADATLLEQVLINLLLNARDAMGSQGRLIVRTRYAELDRMAAELTHTDARAGSYAIVDVQDHGAGIPADIVEHVFEPYFTTRADSGGNGMGLAMVYGVVHRHKGFVTVDSAVGRGSTFSVWLPCPRLGAAAAPAPTEPEGYNVVIVDDEPAILRFTSRVITRAGMRVSTFDDGDQALAFCRRVQVDAAVLDLTMPGVLGGVDLASQLREACPHTTILFHSGYSSDDRVRELGLDDTTFLEKPYTGDVLVAFVLAAIERGTDDRSEAQDGAAPPPKC
jgi:CheY-like chemotaxis protein